MTSNTYSVYLHVFPNGKRYYGITRRDPEARWREGKGYMQKGQVRMRNAVLKYGWVNVTHIVLLSNLTQEEAQAAERYLVENNNTVDPRFGYNMTRGGELVASWLPESRLKAGNTRRGVPLGPLPAEARRRIGEANKRRVFTEATLEKKSRIMKEQNSRPGVRESLRKANEKTAKAVEKISPDGSVLQTFPSLCAASRAHCGSKAKASDVLKAARSYAKGGNRRVFGFLWRVV